MIIVAVRGMAVMTVGDPEVRLMGCVLMRCCWFRD